MKHLIVIAALLCGTAHAEYFTGNDIQKWADGYAANDNTLDFGMLYGYISGVSDTGNGVNHCIPKTVSLRQVIDVVRQHVASAPATRNNTGDTIILYALKQTWPCAPSNRRGATL